MHEDSWVYMWERKGYFLITDIISWYTVDINVTVITVKFLEFNTEGYLDDLGMVERLLLNGTQKLTGKRRLIA